MPLLLLFGGAGPLGAALFVQYVLHYPPCHLCMWQRYPYALPLIAGCLALIPSYRLMRSLLWVGVLGWLLTAGVAGYHIALEQKWIESTGGCSASALSGSVEDIRTQILNAPLVACNETSFTMLGISMAHWNLAAALAFVLMARSVYKQMRPE